jgi:ribonuclease E
MSEPEKSSHWNSISEEVGVTPSADLPRPEAAPVPADTARQSKDQGTQRPAEVEQPTTDWNLLASDLGVQSAPPSKRPAPPPKRPKPPSKRRAAPPRRPASPPEAAVPPHQADRPTEREPEGVSPEVEKAAQDDQSDAAGVDTPEGGPMTASFEVMEEQVDFGETEPAGTSKDAEDAGGGRRRRRRRPRRRSTKKRTAETDEEVSKEKSAGATKPESAEDQPAEDQPTADQPAADADELQPESDSDTQRPTRPSHRNIPAWEEAVSIIVDANIEARASRPKAGRSRSRGGRGRGRKS